LGTEKSERALAKFNLQAKGRVAAFVKNIEFSVKFIVIFDKLDLF